MGFAAISFKPCYKWNTFNTKLQKNSKNVLSGFKPCYKWNTFNTSIGNKQSMGADIKVLNLVISGIPSIHYEWNVRISWCSYEF